MKPGLEFTGADVMTAAAHLQQIFDITPTLPYKSFMIDGHLVNVSVKCEHVGPIRTFKHRGAEYAVYRTITSLPTKEYDLSTLELVTASAGNHAQGVALAASRWKIPATIFVPNGAPAPKTKRVRDTMEFAPGLIRIVESGDTFDKTLESAIEYQDTNIQSGNQTKRVFIPPYQNNHVMMGQGTIFVDYLVTHAKGIGNLQALRILRGREKSFEPADYFTAPDIIIAGAGGGGLITGLGVAARYFNGKLNANTKVVGVQSSLADSLYKSYHSGNTIRSVSHGKTIADGIAVADVTDDMLQLVLKYVDDLLVVEEPEIINSIREFHLHPSVHGKTASLGERYSSRIPKRTLPGNELSYIRPRPLDRIEGAAAAALAGISHLDFARLGLAGKESIDILAILSGGNIADETFYRIIQQI